MTVLVNDRQYLRNGLANKLKFPVAATKYP